MIRNRTIRAIVLMACALVVIRLLMPGADPPRSAPSEALAAGADYALKDFDAVMLDLNGDMNARFSAPSLRHDAVSQMATIVAPDVTLIQPQGRWTLVAETGTLSPDRSELLLESAVDIERTGEQAVTLETEQLMLDIDQRTGHSDHCVEITRPGSTLTGCGFSIDMQTGRYRIEKDLKARYESP